MKLMATTGPSLIQLAVVPFRNASGPSDLIVLMKTSKGLVYRRSIDNEKINMEYPDQYLMRWQSLKWIGSDTNH
mgnify:CR=1 FL=1